MEDLSTKQEQDLDFGIVKGLGSTAVQELLDDNHVSITGDFFFDEWPDVAFGD